MNRLDVVAELAAHQQNLAVDRGGPGASVAPCAVIALPPPALAKLVAPDWYADARAVQLGALAEQLGGGDGPLPIVDLGEADDLEDLAPSDLGAGGTAGIAGDHASDEVGTLGAPDDLASRDFRTTVACRDLAVSDVGILGHASRDLGTTAAFRDLAVSDLGILGHAGDSGNLAAAGDLETLGAPGDDRNRDGLALTDLEIGAFAGGRLGAVLARLWDRGVRRLFVHGACDQPGFARVLGYRWPGGLHVCHGSPLDALLGPPGFSDPVRVLAPGLVRVAPGVPAPRGGERVLAAVDDDGDPRRVADQGPEVLAYALDHARQCGPWSGVVPPRGMLGTAAGAEIRARWDAYWSQRGRSDVVRAAVLGLDPALEASLRDVPRASRELRDVPRASSELREPPARRGSPALRGQRASSALHGRPEPGGSEREPNDASAAPRRARLIAITGIDGAGKSTHVARLARMLGERGARVRVIKLYRQGAFLELANELGARTRRGAPLAAFRVSRVVKLVDSLRVARDQLAGALAACDAVVLDRYVETHVAAAESQLGWDLADHPALAVFPPADLRFWLRLDPGVALARREARGEPASADEHATGLTGYARVFDRLAAAAGEIALDAGADEDGNARAIAERAGAIVAGGVGGERSSPVAPAAAPVVAPPAARRVRSVRRCTLHVGVDPDRPALGGDALALRADLARRSAAAAAGFPEGFWLEAYAAQLVIDARTQALSRATVALWPGALAAMASHADLVMLPELERILAREVEVATYDPRAEIYEATFAALGAVGGAVHRLARDYAVELERVATERGWARAAIDDRASTAAPSAPAS